MKKKIATIILSYNSDAIIKKTILAAKKISKNVIVLDSFSNDNTLKIARSLQCKIFKKNLSIIHSSEITLLKNVTSYMNGNYIWIPMKY